MDPSLKTTMQAQFAELENIAKDFDASSLTEQTAEELYQSVSESLVTIRDTVIDSSINDRDFVVIREQFHNVNEQFQDVFTKQNEKEFEDLHVAHELIDSLKNEIIVKLYHPEFIKMIREMENLIDSAQEMGTGEAINKTLNNSYENLVEMKEYWETHHEDFDRANALWVIDKLDDLVEEMQELIKVLVRPSSTFNDIQDIAQSIQNYLNETFVHDEIDKMIEDFEIV